MRRLSDERGVVAIIVMLSAVAIFAMGAVVVDVAALLQEKRVLQNGADAAALAIAQQCAAGDCADPGASADEYVDLNAEDGVSDVEELCGSLVTGVPACTDPPSLPAGAGYVRVSAQTANDDGGSVVPFSFAQFIGFSGGTVQARSIVAWGGPSSADSELPLTISLCEYNAYTNDGSDLLDPETFTTSGYPDPETTLFFHDTQEAGACSSDDAGNTDANCGSGCDLPGGFGWLDSDDCHATSDTEGWYEDDTGVAATKDCKSKLQSIIDSADTEDNIIHLPIFDRTNGQTGSNGQYHVDEFGMYGFGAFFLTGFRFPSMVDHVWRNTGPECAASQTCISGYFIQDDGAVEGDIGGPSIGVVVIDLIG